MTYETLLVERHGTVGWLIFNRPDVGNSMNAAMFDELALAWIALDDDASIRVIVLQYGA
jgi:enoyl-CoA hydratase/carnithine racemase